MKKLLFAVSLAAVVPCMGVAQSPPIKMGLWRGKAVSTMTGLQIPPEVAAKLKAMGRSVPGTEPTTIDTESCLTPEKWKEMLGKTQDRENCTYSNMKVDSGGMSGDMACSTPCGGSAKGHVQMNFVSDEKVHGTVHMEVITTQRPQPIIMDMTIDSTYEGADCKGISPDEPKVIH
ncbi:MAG TPA: DUF3617 domain-containing protein [Edaphobacter sp.]|jgi:hypothetical protein|nr:DUF3617 domain-containing protein [Edaphobacter sp.]